MRPVTLRGGTHDGETVTLPWWQLVLYTPKIITDAERQALQIDGVVAWKIPDEVYVPATRSCGDGVWVLGRTVEYKP